MESNSDDDLGEWLYLLDTSFLIQPLSADFYIILGLLFFLFIGSALVSGAEVAFFSLNKSHISKLNKDRSYYSKLVITLLDRPRYLLSTILIANNLINVAIIVIFSYSLFHWFNMAAYPLLSFVIEVLLISILILIFGEITPKVYATQKNMQLAKFMSFPLLVGIKIFYPLSYLMVGFTKVIERRMSNNNGDISVADLSHAIDLTHNSGTSKEEKKILKGLVNFGNITTKQVMKNRMDMVAVSFDSDFKSLVNIVKRHGYSRIPVFDVDFDHIKGILYTKNLLEHIDKDASFEWQKLIRNPFFVPEAKKIGDLLKDFQKRKMHFAIVVDEYGGTSGIITLEDVIEEIVGDIHDEYDKDELSQVKLDSNNYIFEGRTLLSDVIDYFNFPGDFFDDIKGDSDSLAGVVIELAGKLPKFRTKVQHKNIIYTVESMSKKRIDKIRITLVEEQSSAVQ